MKKIKTFADACMALKLDPKKLPDVSMLPVIHQKAIISMYKLTIIVEALNEGWKPNWNDSNEAKYSTWFEIKADKKRPSGFGFSGTYYDSWYTNSHTDCGSRLCFKSSELALYAGKQFASEYKDLFLIS
jgi:hypothetical protein